MSGVSPTSDKKTRESTVKFISKKNKKQKTENKNKKQKYRSIQNFWWGNALVSVFPAFGSSALPLACH
jgi:hypothetical protein